MPVKKELTCNNKQRPKKVKILELNIHGVRQREKTLGWQEKKHFYPCSRGACIDSSRFFAVREWGRRVPQILLNTTEISIDWKFYNEWKNSALAYKELNLIKWDVPGVPASPPFPPVFPFWPCTPGTLIHVNDDSWLSQSVRVFESSCLVEKWL